jgi:hypothetical protein
MGRDTPLLRVSGAAVRRCGTERTIVREETPSALHLAQMRDVVLWHGGVVCMVTAMDMTRCCGIDTPCTDGS